MTITNEDGTVTTLETIILISPTTLRLVHKDGRSELVHFAANEESDK